MEESIRTTDHTCVARLRAHTIYNRIIAEQAYKTPHSNTMFAAPQSQTHATGDLVHEPEDQPDDRARPDDSTAQAKGFSKQVTSRHPSIRRESLLTQQLHPKETDDYVTYTFPPATHIISNSSVAELTSDNELTSPGTRGSSPSPPLPPLRSNIFLPPVEKHTLKEPAIAELDEVEVPAVEDPEKKVAADLGRRRCITFACGKKADAPKSNDVSPSRKPSVDSPQVPAEPPKRKCMITFNCPTRTKATPTKPLDLSSRHLSPAPKLHRSPKSPKSPRAFALKNRRDSDMTITNKSPDTVRKAPVVKKNKYVESADEDKLEAKRFHEFAVNAHADEDWIVEATCHRKRLTIKDTLHKENVIRQIGEEVAEEEAEEEEELDDDALLDELEDEEDEDEDDNDDDEDDAEEDDSPRHVMKQAGDSISDGGFDTDDEQGFANSSDSDGDDSDFEWWAPGRSTAATSTDQLEHIRPMQQRRMSDSSLESARAANKSHKHDKSKSRAVKINKAPTPELPDSTDFVCGTLDEDRPLEQAYKLAIEQRKAAKRKVTPQDIDPTFPTSDPEMDEEDEEDEVAQEDDGDQLFMHGSPDINDERGRRNGQKSTGQRPSNSPRRLKSPAPLLRAKSPAPAPRRKSLRSPPPPAKTCNRHRSPAPRKLFGQSPRRVRSPTESNRPSSPPNSRRTSVASTPRPGMRTMDSNHLGGRPAPIRTSSLPRVPTMTKIDAMATPIQDDEDTESGKQRRIRGAIDIVKGLEKKKQRRKEKLYQKHCQKMKKEGERKPKPGKGAERMRELGLELAAYRGKTAKHMLSI